LKVRDGVRVKIGDVVVGLDDTITRVNLAIVTKGLNELYARKARLEAERDGAAAITFAKLDTKAARGATSSTARSGAMWPASATVAAPERRRSDRSLTFPMRASMPHRRRAALGRVPKVGAGFPCAA